MSNKTGVFLETKFTFMDMEYDLLSVIDENDVFGMEKYGKPIIKRSGITKLMKKFDFIVSRHEIKFDNDHTLFEYKQYADSKPTQKCIGKTCSVIVTICDRKNSIYFQGDGESNFLNTSGIGQLYLQAVAKKRAVSRAVLDYLGIDAYGEDEANEFKIDAEKDRTIRLFIAGKISEMAGALDKPLLDEELRAYVREYFGLKPDAKITNLTSDKLISLFFNVYEQLPQDAKNAYKHTTT